MSMGTEERLEALQEWARISPGEQAHLGLTEHGDALYAHPYLARGLVALRDWVLEQIERANPPASTVPLSEPERDALMAELDELQARIRVLQKQGR